MVNQNNISKNKQIPDYLFFSLNHRLIIINFNLLLIIIGTKVIDYITEWNLLKDNKVSNKKKYYLNYLNLIIKEELLKIKEIEKKFLSKSLIIFNKIDKKQIWTSFFEDFSILENTSKKILKKNLKCSIEFDHINFNHKNFYKNIKIIEINATEEEFFKKTVAKLKI